MGLTVVVPAYNRADLLMRCLQSLEEQTLDKEKFEVLVVDNNSSESLEGAINKYKNKFPNFRVVNETKQGLGHARNRGYLEAKFDFVSFVDNDMRLDRNSLERIYTMFTNTNALCVGSKVLPEYAKPKPFWFDDSFEVRTWGEQYRYLNEHEVDEGFSGGCFSFRKSALIKLNGFDVELGMKGTSIGGGEEQDLYRRMKEVFGGSQTM